MSDLSIFVLRPKSKEEFTLDEHIYSPINQTFFSDYICAFDKIAEEVEEFNKYFFIRPKALKINALNKRKNIYYKTYKNVKEIKEKSLTLLTGQIKKQKLNLYIEKQATNKIFKTVLEERAYDISFRITQTLEIIALKTKPKTIISIITQPKNKKHFYHFLTNKDILLNAIEKALYTKLSEQILQKIISLDTYTLLTKKIGINKYNNIYLIKTQKYIDIETEVLFEKEEIL